MILFRLLFLIVFLPSTLWSMAATISPQEELQAYKEKYPNEHAIFLQRSDHYTMDIKKGELDITMQTIEERLLLTERASSYAEDYLNYTSFSPLIEKEAYSLIPDGNRYDKRKVSVFKESDDFAEYAFYDDTKKISFNYSGLRAGAKTYLSHTHRVEDPRFVTGFYFKSYIPSEQNTLTIEAHEDIQLHWDYFGTDTANIQFSKEQKGNKITYRWTHTNAESIEYSNQSPNIAYYAPQVIVRIKQYTDGGKTYPVLRHLQDLYAWYVSLTQPIVAADYSDLKPLADSITKGYTTDVEKASAIHTWARKHIKYIAIADGLGGYKPRKPRVVNGRRYGDCKDMSCLQYALMQAAGIEGATIGWVGTLSKPYSYRTNPTPMTDNHMVGVLEANDTVYILDATLPSGSITQPPYHLQNKELLIYHSPKEYRLYDIPMSPAVENQYNDTTYIRVHGDQLKGVGYAFALGYMADDMRVAVERFDEDRLENYYQNIFRKGNNTCLTIVDSVTGETLKSGPLYHYYHFTIDNYVSEVDDEIYVNPHLYKRLPKPALEATDVPYAKQNTFPMTQQFHTRIEVPDGYGVQYLPNNMAYENDKLGYRVKYQWNKKENLVTIDTYVKENYLFLYEKEYPAYNTMMDVIRKSFNELIIFKRL